ncbi:hypothetical protein [Pseudoteredinibacter isoporae]|uniref:hypothetical protein n=1 Tax=Pseudoteredinibacter isoporae TaxID=570281 RepID=UPI003101FA7E
MDELDMNNIADKFIADRGMPISNYYIEVTPFSELICFKGEDGREYDLPISDETLAIAVKARLRELGVKVVELK